MAQLQISNEKKEAIKKDWAEYSKCSKVFLAEEVRRMYRVVDLDKHTSKGLLVAMLMEARYGRKALEAAKQ